ncbi:hypothetical protein EV424DRAFT_889931 [Suillus variegatus]|nr:hypothetical protein EV424DRAFT_889931 [Suillus variegatus]
MLVVSDTMETGIENVRPIASIYATILLACGMLHLSTYCIILTTLSRFNPRLRCRPHLGPLTQYTDRIRNRPLQSCIPCVVGRHDFSEDIYFCRVKPIMRLVCVTFFHLNRTNSFSDALWRIPGRGRERNTSTSSSFNSTSTMSATTSSGTIVRRVLPEHR